VGPRVVLDAVTKRKISIIAPALQLNPGLPARRLAKAMHRKFAEIIVNDWGISCIRRPSQCTWMKTLPLAPVSLLCYFKLKLYFFLVLMAQCQMSSLEAVGEGNTGCLGELQSLCPRGLQHTHCSRSKMTYVCFLGSTAQLRP